MMDYLIDVILVFLPLAIKFKELKLSFPINKRKIIKLFSSLGLKRLEAAVLVKKTLIIIVTLFAALFILSILLSLVGIHDDEIVIEKISNIAYYAPLIFVYLLIVRPIAEEIFFRGFLINKTGNVIQAALFGLMHYGYGSYIEMAGAFVLGLLLGKWILINKNLFPNITAHLLYNVIILGIVGVI